MNQELSYKFLTSKGLTLYSVHALPPKTMRDFHEYLIKSKYQPTTINRIMYFVQSCFTYGRVLGMLTDNPLLHYQIEETVQILPQPLTAQELLLLYTSNLHNDLQLIADTFWLNVDTGYHF